MKGGGHKALCPPSFFRWHGLGGDGSSYGLGHRRTNSLEEAKADQLADVCGESAKQRSDHHDNVAASQDNSVAVKITNLSKDQLSEKENPATD